MLNPTNPASPAFLDLAVDLTGGDPLVGMRRDLARDEVASRLPQLFVLGFKTRRSMYRSSHPRRIAIAATP